MKLPRSHISYSAMSKYLECPKRWFYDYVMFADRRVESFALTLGSLYHDAVEGLYNTGEFEENLKKLEDYASEVPRFRQKEVKKVVECFKNYYMEVYPLYASRVEQVELKDEVSIAGVEVPMQFRMDLVTTDGIIVDHKTVGRFVPRLDYSMQFDLYAYAYYRKYGRLPRGIEYHYAYKLTGGVEVKSGVPTMSGMLKAVACVVGAVKGIKNDIFIPKYSKSCNYCPHKGDCDREYGVVSS